VVKSIVRMTGMLMLVCLLCLMMTTETLSIPIVISRYGGRSRKSKISRQLYEREKRSVANTCSVTRMVIPGIVLGECPRIQVNYQEFYARGSKSSLDEYYKGRCDILDYKYRGKPYPVWVELFVIFSLILCVHWFLCVVCFPRTPPPKNRYKF